VAIGVDGSMYFTHSFHDVEFPERRGCIRHVRASGYIYTVAGLGAGLSEAEEEASPTGAVIWNKPGRIAMTPDGDLYIAEYFPDRIRKVTTGLPGSDYGSSILVDAKNGRAETFVFSPSGRHLATLDAASPDHRPRYEFFYTGTGTLDHVEDGNRPVDGDGNILDGNITQIGRDAAGDPAAIVAPFGQVTTLTVDENGYLDSVANPAGEAHTIGYANGGLLTRFENPLGAASKYEYDPMGRLTRAEDADGVYVEIERVETDAGRTMTIRKPGYVEVVEYDIEGRKLSRTDPAGTTDYALNVDGLRDAIYDRRGLVVKYVRDAENRVIRRVGPFDPQLAEPETFVEYEYDERGNTTKVIDENGVATSYAYAVDRLESVTTAAGSTTYTYDHMNRKIKEMDPALAFTEWHYDDRGLLTEISGSAANGGGCSSCGQAAGASGALGTYSHDERGRVDSFVDLEGHETRYLYHDADRRTKVIDARTYETGYAYDAAGRLKSVTDANTYQTKYDYTPAGRLLSVENGAGDKVAYGYDSAGRQETVTDDEGGTRTTVYDAMGRVKEVKDALNRTTGYAYDSEGNMTSMTDAAGVLTTYEHDAKGNVVLTTADANGLAAEMASEYDPGGRLVKTIDPLLHGTTFAYDDANRLVKVTSHLGRETIYAYDAVGRQKSVTSGGRTRLTTYNNAGWVTQVNDGETVTDYFYDEVGNRTQVKVSGRAPVDYFYDDANNLIRTEQSDGVETIVTERIVDPVGNVLTSIDGEQNETIYAYDGANRLTNVTNPASEETTYAYDGAGRRTGVTFANGSSRSYRYDKAGQLTETSGGPEGKLTYAYDDLGRQTSVTDANSRSRETDYDALGRVTEVRNEMSQPVTYAYDIAGRRTSLTDANGNATAYIYDADNRLVSMTYPEVAGQPANVETYGYDTGGLLTSKITPNGDEIGYGYDNAGRLSSVEFGGRTVAYGRDGAGAVTSVGGAGDITTVGYGYDQFGRMISSSDSTLMKTISYANDRRGLRTGLALDGTTVSYGYDEAGRLESVTKDLDSPARYAYDDGGRRTGLDLPNGVSTSYGYDGNDRLLSLATTGPAGTLASFTYDLDDTGNRDGIAYADGSRSDYEYDNAYRLTKETRTDSGGGTAYEIAYQYDAVGNRIRMTSLNAKPYAADHDATDGGTTALFHLNEPEGSTTVADSSGSALVGDVYGSVALGRPGRFSTAAYFDGTSGSEIVVPDAPELELADNPFTLEAWIRIDASMAGSAGAVASKWYSGGETAYLLLINEDGKLEGRLWDSGSSAEVTVVSDAALPAGVGGSPPNGGWVHVAMERSSAGALALYVDNTKQADTAAAAFSVADTAESFRVGAAAGDMYLVGTIDEVRLTVMTAATPARGEAGDLGRVTVDYVYNPRNQLTTETSGTSVKTYSYDANGNVLSIIEEVGGVEVSAEHMEYDELNRMLSHTGPKGTETFTYRGAEWHRASANGTKFLYDGDNVLADIAGGVTDAFYVTPFLDQNLSMTTSAGTYYYSQDGLGSVRTLTDSAGMAVNSYDYLPFGGAYQPGTNVTVEQRYTYTGREKNPESALMYHRYRQYDPKIGLFPGRDPRRYFDGPVMYTYMGASPVSRHDPMGLSWRQCPANSLATARAICFLEGKALAYCKARHWNLVVVEFDEIRYRCCAAQTPKTAPPKPKPKPSSPGQPPTDPTKPPGPGYEWRPAGSRPGIDKGGWHNPNTGESLHPDLNHPDPIGPHWDYKGPYGPQYRWYPDGRMVPKP
jgi:RHS repeat-associated protein